MQVAIMAMAAMAYYFHKESVKDQKLQNTQDPEGDMQTYQVEPAVQTVHMNTSEDNVRHPDDAIRADIKRRQVATNRCHAEDEGVVAAKKVMGDGVAITEHPAGGKGRGRAPPPSGRARVDRPRPPPWRRGPAFFQ